MDYSTKRISTQLIEEIKNALQSVTFGSVEIYVTDNNVTQITTRTIKKTSIRLNEIQKSTKRTVKIVSKSSISKSNKQRGTKMYGGVVSLRTAR